jgi:hypothetical protein
MAVTPPLDIIPMIPNKLMALVIDLINKQLDKIQSDTTSLLKQTIKLPDDCKCDDPRIKKAKDTLNDLNEGIQKLQTEIPPIVEKVQTALQIATTVAASIKVAQLMNPVTAGPVIASELVEIQNTTIANAITSVNQLNVIPGQLQSRLESMSKDIASSLINLNSVCGNSESFDIPSLISNDIRSEMDNITGNQLSDDLNSEFYQTVNVSDDDITQRNELISQLVDRQLDLLSSLQEAPSQVFQETVPPDNSIGKTGDYYIDTANKMMYGPKPSRDDWGTGINY